MEKDNFSHPFEELSDAEEHDLFHLLKTVECLKVSSVLPVKEELTSLELAVYNFLLNHLKDFSSNKEKFNIQILKNNLGEMCTDDDLVNAFRALDKKYYTECAFDDNGKCAWIKLL